MPIILTTTVILEINSEYCECEVYEHFYLFINATKVIEIVNQDNDKVS